MLVPFHFYCSKRFKAKTNLQTPIPINLHGVCSFKYIFFLITSINETMFLTQTERI